MTVKNQLQNTLQFITAPCNKIQTWKKAYQLNRYKQDLRYNLIGLQT